VGLKGNVKGGDWGEVRGGRFGVVGERIRMGRLEVKQRRGG